ncbi:MAG: inositol monophosphatase [Candidatus Rokuibacteriota bacterium]
MRDPRLDLALSLAAEGGRRAVASLGHVSSAWKRPGERITSVDTEIQSRMLREIQTWFPGDGVVAEEAGGRLGVDREFVWALDPLDGTNNFALGLPCFAVSVGILRAGEPYAGVVHDPNTGLVVHALRGGGAFSGERRLALAAQPLHGASNVCVRAPVSPALRPLVDTWLARHKLRAFGSVALHLAYAAMGAIDLVVDDRATLWDIAAGGTILLEAGGSLSALDGAPLFPIDLARVHDAPMPFVAGNGGAHGEAVAALAREPAFDVLRSPRRLGLEPHRRAQ